MNANFAESSTEGVYKPKGHASRLNQYHSALVLSSDVCSHPRPLGL